MEIQAAICFGVHQVTTRVANLKVESRAASAWREFLLTPLQPRISQKPISQRHNIVLAINVKPIA